MRDKKTIFLLALIMAAVALVAGMASMAFLYQTAFDKEQERLRTLVSSQAQLIAAVARFDAIHSQSAHPEGAAAATLAQLSDAYANSSSFGQTGAFIVGRRVGNEIWFPLAYRGDQSQQIAPVPWDSDLAEPMRRALRGESGVMVGRDYGGQWVLAAYDRVTELGVGLVAKIDLAEIRAPFVRAALIALAVMLAAIAVGSLLFFRVVNPIIEQVRRQNLILEKSHASLARAQQIAHLGNWDWDIVHNTLAWSDEIYRIFGCAPQQFGATYEAFLNFVHADDRERVTRAVDQTLRGERDYAVEHRIVRPDGSLRVVFELGEVVRDAQGTPLRMHGIVHDITERKQAEERLLLSDRVIRSTSEGVMVTTRDGHIVDVNEAFTTITGYARAEVIGQNPSLMKSGRQPPAFYEEMWRQITTQGSWSGEIWDRRKDGTEYPKWLSINAVKDEQGQVSHYIGIFSDISKAKATEERLLQLAFYDTLTGLPNRALCRERLQQEIRIAQRHAARLAVLYMDLDRFKYVNDTLGHAVGDQLLVEAAHRIRACLRDADTVARLGGDEFAIILNDVTDAAHIEQVASAIILRLSEKFIILGKEINVGVSIGISLYPDNGTTYEALTRNADAAMYRAKDAGRNTFRFFNDELHAAMQRRLELEKRLRSSLERQELSVHYQPKVELGGGTMVGMEALVRWRCPEGEASIPPAEFIPLAEENGLILPLGNWVLRQACAQNAEWIADGRTPLRVSVNLSARQFEQKDLVAQVAAVLAETGLDARHLELEITESVIMGDEQGAIQTLTQLRELGVHLSIDDFGTGYSSLAALKRLPIQTLKIDQSFVGDLDAKTDSRAIVAAIISMADSLGLTVIAEGVETQAQLDYLRQQGCDEIQGFYYSKPLSPAEFLSLLEQARVLPS